MEPETMTPALSALKRITDYLDCNYGEEFMADCALIGEALRGREGYVLVPVEPTKEMVLAGLRAYIKAIGPRPDNFQQLVEQKHPDYYARIGKEITNGHEVAIAPYRAMLSASPKAPNGEKK